MSHSTGVKVLEFVNFLCEKIPSDQAHNQDIRRPADPQICDWPGDTNECRKEIKNNLVIVNLFINICILCTQMESKHVQTQWLSLNEYITVLVINYEISNTTALELPQFTTVRYVCSVEMISIPETPSH